MSKRNSNQKLTKKNWKVIFISVALGVLASALAFSITDVYDNVDFKDNLTRHPQSAQRNSFLH